ncbi:hypothetical protein EYF80_024550 [Liparis tanakae]|uniref:Uncharacterized protein n=1 Tax=Liparis tanakae TaxID=230148 RepID=A0A4Z2HI45_9TELE|nr:hypothetical protein EYF80_024550 [Liparis tanakae]
MSETQGFPAKPHTQESMTSPGPAPKHFCGFSQTVAHKNSIPNVVLKRPTNCELHMHQKNSLSNLFQSDFKEGGEVSKKGTLDRMSVMILSGREK